MKLSPWLWGAVAVVACVVLAGLSWRPVEASSGQMPTVAKKPAIKKAATPARGVFRRSATALPLPPATAPTGPIGAAEVAAMGKGVDFASIRRASETRARRAR